MQRCIEGGTPCLRAVAADCAGEEMLGGQAQGDGGWLVQGEAAAAVEAVKVCRSSEQVRMAVMEQMLTVVMACTQCHLSTIFSWHPSSNTLFLLRTSAWTPVWLRRSSTLA